MKMSVKEYQKKMDNLALDIKHILNEGGYDWDYGTFDNVTAPENADERQILNTIIRAADKLEAVVSSLKYLSRPVVTEQTLCYDPTDERYKCDYCTYTCGKGIEFYYYNEDMECYEWAESRVEYSDGYYIVGYRNVSLDGLRVRFR